MAAQDASTATTATVSRPQDWDDFNPLFDIFPQIYYNGTRLTKTANEEKFRDVLRQVQNLCLRPVKDDKRPLHLHPPSPTILVGNGPTRSAACLEVPGPPVRRTSAYVRSGIAGDLDVPEGRGGSSWNEIVQSFAHNQNIAKEFIAAPDINIVQLTEACCRKQTLEESQKLRDVLIERIALDVADRPTIFHTLLRELVYHRRIQDICTTNFDNILEYALDEKSCNRLNTATQRVHILVKNPILAPLNRAILWPGASPRAVLVHKMHGSIPLNVRPRNIDEFPDTEPITYSDHKHWGDTIVLSQRDYDAYLGELHHTFPGSLLSEALSCFTICCGKNFYTEDQTFLYALRQTQYARQAKGVVIDGERFGGIVLYTANPSMSDLLNLSTTGMLAFVVAENATISEYLRRFNGLLGPTSPFAFTDERLQLVSTNDSLSILLRVTISLMVLFDAIGINGYPELFVQQVSAIMDHLLEQTTGIVSEPLDVADELDELDLNDLEGSRGRVHSRSSSQGSVGGRPVLRNRHMSEACLSDVARIRRRG